MDTGVAPHRVQGDRKKIVSKIVRKSTSYLFNEMYRQNIFALEPYILRTHHHKYGPTSICTSPKKISNSNNLSYKLRNQKGV